MKTIWILNHYAVAMFFNKGGMRHHYFAKYLKEAGYDVRIFCASSRHNGEENLIKDGRLYYSDESEGIEYTFVQARDYKGNGKERVLNMIDYYRNVKKTAKHFPKPDVIIGSSVHPLACVAAINLSKKFKCKNIVEIRDLWPETIFEFTKIKKNSVIGKLLQYGEKWIYKKADKLIFTMEGYYDYIIEQKWEKAIPKSKCFYLNNGVDLQVFDENKEVFKIEDKDVNDKSKFKVIYVGSIRTANGLGSLLDVGKKIKENGYRDIEFLIWGSGKDEEDLREKIIEEKITNVKLKGKVDKNHIPYIVSNADLNILTYIQTDIERFGQSNNKYFEYLAAGKPILSTIKIGYSLTARYSCGIELCSQSVETITDAILQIYRATDSKKKVYGDNSRKASKDFDFKTLTQKLMEIIER